MAGESNPISDQLEEEPMKKSTAWILAAVAAFSFAAAPCFGQSAQDVLNKMIDAQGGRKFLETIKDSTMTGTMELTQMGMSGTVTMYQKEPNKMRMDMEIMGMVITQAYDGQKAWTTNPQTGATEEMPEAQAKEMARQALGSEALLNPQKLGITYQLLPKATFDGKDYLALEQTMADGHKSVMYVDPATYLTYRVDTTGIGQSGVEAKVESYQSDYRKVGQAMVAHSIRIVQDGAEFAKMTVTKMTYNTPLDDALFAIGK
jgi:outer membrane lipoprotein-sorting protein